MICWWNWGSMLYSIIARGISIWVVVACVVVIIFNGWSFLFFCITLFICNRVSPLLFAAAADFLAFDVAVAGFVAAVIGFGVAVTKRGNIDGIVSSKMIF